MASRVPHASFIANFSQDAEFSHPPGASFARLLEHRLRSVATVAGFENWRDCGWSVNAAVGEKRFEVYFAPFEANNRWLLVAAPLGQPGICGRLLGRKPVPVEQDLRVLCDTIHALLISTAGVSDVRWMFGGPPGKVPHVDEPAQLGWSIAL